MTPRRLVILSLGVLALALLTVGGVLVLSDGDDEPTSATPTGDGTGAPEDERLGGCEAVPEDLARDCYAPVLKELVEGADDPLSAVAEISAAAYADPRSFLLPNCHGLMHTVGREYAVEHGVTLATLMDYLPETNDPGCSAGFAHGLVTGVAPQIDVSRPEGAADVCAETQTRYQRYSCVHGFGHAFMRIAGEDLGEALALCTALGPQAGPDCAQGAFHDYWFAVVGLDDTERPPTVVEDPRELCSDQPEEYVRQCWYRAFLDARSEEVVAGPADFERLCSGLEGLQRESCVTAVSVIGPPDPRLQLSLCNELVGADEVACVRGVKVQNLRDIPLGDLIALIRQCDGMPVETRPDCYRWLGKVLEVVTDGAFERDGCPEVPDPPSRRACVEGARSSEEALVTFS